MGVPQAVEEALEQLGRAERPPESGRRWKNVAESFPETLRSSGWLQRSAASARLQSFLKLSRLQNLKSIYNKLGGAFVESWGGETEDKDAIDEAASVDFDGFEWDDGKECQARRSTACRSLRRPKSSKRQRRSPVRSGCGASCAGR